ncbi:MAG: hypothetical protein JNJ49_00830 [Bdellovibrionaceae bacterium]|nr:hypothetical protein [Pseudobdellovibrionaceae bacterium]
MKSTQQTTQHHSVLRDLAQFGLDPHDWIERPSRPQRRSTTIESIEFAHRDDHEIRLIGAVTNRDADQHRHILYLELQMRAGQE